MIKKLLLTILLFSLQGCTWQNLFFNNTPFDMMTVVNYEGKIRNSRGYYKRSNLLKFKDNLYYKIFFNTKKRTLYILLHKPNGYFLYTISNSTNKVGYLGNSHTSYNSIMRKLQRKGIMQLSRPYTKGYQLTYAFKKYKNIKTILFSLSDYSTLLPKYRKAIRHYNYHLVQHEHHIVPKLMVEQLYSKYKLLAKTKQQKEAIFKIGYKLGFEKKPTLLTKQKNDKKSTLIKESKNTVPQDIKPKIIQKNQIKEKTLENKHLEVCSDTQENSTLIKDTSYQYYLHNATLNALNAYIEKLSLQGYDKDISQAQLHQLLLRQNFLKEQALLEHGTLEELIQAYKKNKQKRYKNKILLLMKKEKMK